LFPLKNLNGTKKLAMSNNLHC